MGTHNGIVIPSHNFVIPSHNLSSRAKRGILVSARTASDDS
jgi:hypothetical protein